MDGKFFFISHITPHISSSKEFFSEGGGERDGERKKFGGGKGRKRDRPSETLDLKMTPLTDEPVTSAKKEEENAFSFCLSSFSWPGVKDTYHTSQKNVFRAFYFSFSDLWYTKEGGGDLASCWTCCSIPLLHNKTQEGKKERGALIPGFFSPPLPLSSFLNFSLKNFFCCWSSRQRRRREREKTCNMLNSPNKW